MEPNDKSRNVLHNSSSKEAGVTHMSRRNESFVNADLENEVGLSDQYTQQNSNGNVMKIVA